mmetsp:Transcript_34956/g.108193  ORF Transcript_34956/g.108193 Transcript_34956/m.108193 type:complete len:199 (-) Transcript_34956:715-1311(-)
MASNRSGKVHDRLHGDHTTRTARHDKAQSRAATHALNGDVLFAPHLATRDAHRPLRETDGARSRELAASGAAALAARRAPAPVPAVTPKVASETTTKLARARRLRDLKDVASALRSSTRDDAEDAVGPKDVALLCLAYQRWGFLRGSDDDDWCDRAAPARAGFPSRCAFAMHARRGGSRHRRGGAAGIITRATKVDGL